MDDIRKQFTTLTLVMIPVAIAINIAIGQLVVTLKIPLYLDSVGTVLVGVLGGPWVGALTGFLANLIWGLTGLNVVYAPFAAVAGIIGLMAGGLTQLGWFKRWWKVILGGLITGFVAAILSAPIAAYVFGGVTGAGTDILVAAFRQMGLDVLGASMAQGVASDPLDKAISFLIVWLIIRALPMRFLARFPQSEEVQEAQEIQEPVSE